MAYKILFGIVIVGTLAFYFYPKDKGVEQPVFAEPVVETSETIPDVTVLEKGLNIPWDIAFLDDGSYFITERVGNLLHIKDGVRKVIKLPHPVPKGEGGLLGMALHQHSGHETTVYLYMTTSEDKTGTMNAVYQYEFINDELKNEKVIIENIPGALYHDGGRMEFDSDGYLYITTGDATKSDIAQNLKSLGGKILRLNEDGSIPKDNPFGTAVWSYGHRNPQGLAWDSEGNLWETEHGRSGVVTGYDEINKIEKGKNYGWPVIEGPATKNGMVAPVLDSGSKYAWAPASLLYYRGSLFFGGLKGEALYEYVIDTKELKEHFKNEFGRIRTIRKGPDGMFYLLTSNRDGRGKPTDVDDRLIRINPDQFNK